LTSYPDTLPSQMTKQKVIFIDHIKVLLTILVVLHHAAITYGGPGGWYYREPNSSLPESILLTVFASVNQSFFMGLFFFLSALFIPGSLSTKGTGRFLIDRLKRLGIPLVFYSIVLSPVINYIAEGYGYHIQSSFMEYMSGYHHWIDFGVLWFVAALLLFTLSYLLFRQFNMSLPALESAPADRTIFLIALLLGVISFLVRIEFPVGWTWWLFGFQFGHFSQYIAAFCFGLIAAENNWLNQLATRRSSFWLTIVLLLIFAGFPFMYFMKEITGSPMNSFSGGFHWQSFMVAIWEQLTGFSMSMFLLCFGQSLWNQSTSFLKPLSRSAFAAYIIHPVILVSLAVLAGSWTADPGLKLLVIGPSAVVVTFLIAFGLTRSPVIRQII
jgi:Acyltransferase family